MSGRSSTSPTKSARRPTTRGNPSNLRTIPSQNQVTQPENSRKQETGTQNTNSPHQNSSQLTQPKVPQPLNSEDRLSTDTRPTLERFVDGAEANSIDAEEDSLANRQLFDQMGDDDPETAELARLRCSSIQTEVISERSRRTGQASAGYPGLSFGNSVFGSNTMMKLRIISNELHNIMNVYLKRAEGEIVALNNRVKVLEDDLGKSEEGLKEATSSLEEATQAMTENESIGEEIQTRDSMEDGRLALLDLELNKAKELAEETDKNYKDMAQRISLQELVPYKLEFNNSEAVVFETQTEA